MRWLRFGHFPFGLISPDSRRSRTTVNPLRTSAAKKLFDFESPEKAAKLWRNSELMEV